MSLNNPKRWGDSAWKFLHNVSLGYPEEPTFEDKQNYYNLFSNLGNILPCKLCRTNEKVHFSNKPLTIDDLKDRTSLVNWVIDHHNEVNRSLGKRTLTREEAYDAITRGKKEQPVGLYISGAVAVLVCIVIAVYLINKRKK